MSAQSAFLQLYAGLGREGPGQASDVTWALSQFTLADGARALDAGCGSGADIAALLAAGVAHVTAVDKHAVFTDAARARHAHDTRVLVQTGDMLDPKGPFDLIWSAGAVYFLGIRTALDAFRQRLAPGGVVVFSELCWFHTEVSADARAFWAGHTAMTDEAGVRAQIEACGYEIIAQMRLGDDAWEGYYQPLEARMTMLGTDANAEMQAVIGETRTETDLWRRRRNEYGYLMNVVRPK